MKSARSKRFSWRERGLILALLLLGAGLRLWAVGRIPTGLYHDEAQHGLDALNVLQGDLPFYFANNNGREPLFIYMVTACVGLLGRSPLAVRLPAFFAGFLTLAATYDLGCTLFGEKTGRWALAILAVTFWHVHLSRVGFRAVLLPPFTALFLSQAARAIKTNRSQYWITAGILYGTAWYTYMAVRATPAVLLVLALYAYLFHKERALALWRGTVIFCIAALIILAPLGAYTLKYPDIVLSRTGHVSILNAEVNEGNLWGTLARHTIQTLAMFFVRGDRIWRHNLAWRPVWGPALGFAFILGVGVLAARFRRHMGAATTLLWTGIMLLPTLLAEDAPHFLRASGILPVAILIPAAGMTWIEESLHKRNAPIARYAAWGLPLLLWSVGLTSTTYDYFVRYANAPLMYHWFESGPVELAGEINALRDEGWDGQQMHHGPDTGQQIYVADQIWNTWTSLPFLVPEARRQSLPKAGPYDQSQGLAFVVWPYRDWPPKILPYLEHPGYFSVTTGPKAQGDKDEAPFTLALTVRAGPPIEIPQLITRFEEGISLRGIEVQRAQDDVRILLWWEANHTLSAPYTVFAHYLRDGETLAQHDGQPGKGFLPTTFWQPGDIILDEHILSDVIPDPTQDILRIGLYQSDTGAPLSILDGAGNPAGTWIDLNVTTP